jgi:hypothetical protein
VKTPNDESSRVPRQEWARTVTDDDSASGARQTVPVGRRFDRQVTPVTRRVVAESRVVRVLVRDEAGEVFSALVAPADPPLLATEPGRWYRFADLVGSAPPAPPVDGVPCPGCGGPTRQGCVADTVDPAVSRAAIRVGIDDPFAVVDGRTTVRQRTDGDGDRIGSSTVDPPAAVCDACVDVVA